VHGIVQAHDGEIAVYSEPGEGTTVGLYVPYATEEVAGPQEAPPSPVTDPHTGHILVVDDDAQIIELEAVRLRRLGYEVTTCETGAEALKTFDAATASFAAVVTDYAMPGMNGLSLTRELRDRQYGRPVLLLSGFSAQVSPEDMRDAGVTAFLRKPVGGDELKSTLSRLLDVDD
jgi:CheY-like chemotaxis protein